MADFTQRRPMVAVIGNARLPNGDHRLVEARDCGTFLIDAGCRLLTGGLGGVMHAACAGARQSRRYQSGDVIGLLPGHDPDAANEDVDISLATGLDLARNLIVANADAVIAIGGGAGTLSEIALAWQMHRLIIGLRVQGWSGEMADRRVDDRQRYPDIESDRVYGAAHAKEAVALVMQLLPAYRRRHGGVV